MRFGTDGIRGHYPDDVSEVVAYRLGRAVAATLGGTVAVGADTRSSSPSLARAVLAGLRAGGATAVNLGIFTTPGVAVIAQRHGWSGVVVSASHNPYEDNGLKVLGVGGAKLDPTIEAQIEEALTAAPVPDTTDFPEVVVDANAAHEYSAHLRSLVPADLAGLHVVLDCANGAASGFAPAIFTETGARVSVLHAEPDGRNINANCGSTHPASLVEAVRATGADLGLAFDGDADRLIAVDANGTVRDGDDLMVLFALDFHERAEHDGGVVVTLMSNLGLKRALARAGVPLVETDVGDRNVAMALDERGWPFGGEQSGHLIFRDLAPTGDGLLTGLLLCDLVRRRGPLGDQADASWRRVPQVLINVARDRYDDEGTRALFEEARVRFDVHPDDVRLLIRPSGTEPVTRVMIEALDAAFVDEVAATLQRHHGD